MATIETFLPDIDRSGPGRVDIRDTIWRLWSALLVIRRNRRTRRQLRDISSAALEDIGITRRQAEAEIRRSALLF